MRLKMLQFGSNFKMTEKTPQSRCLEIQQSIVDIKKSRNPEQNKRTESDI